MSNYTTQSSAIYACLSLQEQAIVEMFSQCLTVEEIREDLGTTPWSVAEALRHWADLVQMWRNSAQMLQEGQSNV